MEIYINRKGISPEVAGNRYLEGGTINTSRTIVKDSIPNFNNNLVFDTSLLTSTQYDTDFKRKADSEVGGWQQLYTTNHKPKDPWTGASYGPYINTNKLWIKDQNNDFNFTSWPRSWAPGVLGEPYIVSNIPKSGSDMMSGRVLNTNCQRYSGCT